jgi:hypothetical protein
MVAAFMRTLKLYDSTRHPEPAANVAVLENLTVVVHQIRRGEVLFVLNPNIQSFCQSKSNQEISFAGTDETVLLRLESTSAPVHVSAGGASYQVSIAEVGAEAMPGVKGHLAYCILDVVPHAQSGAPA